MKKKDIEQFRVTGGKFRLEDFPSDWDGSDLLPSLARGEIKARAEQLLTDNLKELAKAQDLLYADDRYALLIVIQALDAAGKDGLIKHVMSGVNPQGCQVFSFKQPSAEELDHTFLWRYSRCLPERGRIGLFNRSYYEEVLVVRVHPELFERQKLPEGCLGKQVWKQRFEDIRNFEEHLVRNGTRVVKFFLNVSKKEQKKRFLERIDNPEKNWKFSEADIRERKLWRDYQRAYEEMIAETSTKAAPWYVLPADHKWVTRALASEIIVRELGALGLKYPTLSKEAKSQLAAARAALLAER